MMCYYLNVHFQGQRVNVKRLATAIYQTVDTQPLQLVSTAHRDSREAHGIRLLLQKM